MTIALVMGVSGCGKTTIARGLADRMGWQFQEGDALHPAANVAKMVGGMPLTDDDRAPWLAAIAVVLKDWDRTGVSGVVTCSALKRAYRAKLLAGLPSARLVYLAGDQTMIAARLAARKDHFMPPGLLASQFTALEPPGLDERPLIVAIDQAPDVMVAKLVAAFSSSAI